MAFLSIGLVAGLGALGAAMKHSIHETNRFVTIEGTTIDKNGQVSVALKIARADGAFEHCVMQMRAVPGSDSGEHGLMVSMQGNTCSQPPDQDSI